MTTTTIDPNRDLMTLINVFEVDPTRCDELVEDLVTATDETISGLDGFVSANIHRSDDGTRVVNYAQWASRAAYQAMLGHPDVHTHLQSAAAIAEAFNPIIVSVAHSRSTRRRRASKCSAEAARPGAGR